MHREDVLNVYCVLILFRSFWKSSQKIKMRYTWLWVIFLAFLYFVYRVFFSLVPPKKIKYGKPRLGESTLT